MKKEQFFFTARHYAEIKRIQMLEFTLGTMVNFANYQKNTPLLVFRSENRVLELNLEDGNTIQYAFTFIGEEKMVKEMKDYIFTYLHN